MRPDRDREVRVVVFCGKGDHFCSGFDVGDPEASLNNNEEDTVDWMFRRENTQEEIDLWMKIRNMRKPTIGAMKGSVLGGGWFMAMTFDCLIAADTTVFDNLEFALGMGYTIYLPWDAYKIPMNIAKQKAFTGEATTAEEGYRYGLFNQVVPVDKLDDAVMRLARRMLRLSSLHPHRPQGDLQSVSDMMGMQQIVPFAKETFSIGMELPGTKENRRCGSMPASTAPRRSGSISPAHRRRGGGGQKAPVTPYCFLPCRAHGCPAGMRGGCVCIFLILRQAPRREFLRYEAQRKGGPGHRRGKGNRAGHRAPVLSRGGQRPDRGYVPPGG